MLRGPSPGEAPASIPPPRPEVTRLIDEGFSALRAGRRDEARRAWEEALELDPDNRQIEVNLRKLIASGSRELGAAAPPSAAAGTRETG
jgi:Flp pilus assembly protein TadD